MFIAHTNGQPIVLKTNRGPYPVAFVSWEDGLAFLRWQRAPGGLGTLDRSSI